MENCTVNLCDKYKSKYIMGVIDLDVAVELKGSWNLCD